MPKVPTQLPINGSTVTSHRQKPIRYEIILRGWTNWYRGIIATSLAELFPKPTKQKHDILEILLSHTAEQWKCLWSEHNKITHNNHTTTELSQRHARAMTEFEHIYNRRHLYLSKGDKYLLLELVEKHKKLPLASIKNWLLLYRGVFQQSAQDARIHALTGVRIHFLLRPHLDCIFYSDTNCWRRVGSMVCTVP